MKNAVRLFSIVWCLVILLGCMIVPTSAASSGSVYADLNVTDVTDDLEQLGFDLAEYPIDQTISAGQTDRFLVMMQVLEFGYDYHQKDFSDYGLFLYLYNPSVTDLTGTSKNHVELALKTASGAMGEYSKHELLRISASEDHRFYKFRVMGMTATLLRTLNRDRRTYCISGVEIQFAGDTNPTEFEIGGTYTFSGHQQGYGFNKSMPDSLYLTYQTLETIQLDLHPTTWRSEYQSEKGANWRDEVDSVYFAIPNWYFKQYGNSEDPNKGLYSARVSYYERYVNGIVSDNEEMVIYLQNHNDNQVKAFTEDDPFSAYSGYEVIGSSNSHTSLRYDFAVNAPDEAEQSFYHHSVSHLVKNILPRVGMTLYSGTYDSISAEDFALEFDSVSDPNMYIDGSDVLYGPFLSKPLLAYSPAGRELGYHEETLTADQVLKYTDTSAWNENSKGISKWFYRLFHKDESAKVGSQTLEVMETVDLTDLVKLAAFKDEVSAKQHYISEADVPKFLAYVAKEELNPTNWTNGVFGSTVVLLHFAVTDFYTTSLTCYKGYNGAATGAEQYSGNHYYFEKSYF